MNCVEGVVSGRAEGDASERLRFLNEPDGYMPDACPKVALRDLSSSGATDDLSAGSRQMVGLCRRQRRELRQIVWEETLCA